MALILTVDEAVTNAEFVPLISTIEAGNDYYLVGKDFPSYIEVQEKVDEVRDFSF